ncbi:hypothetical protein VZT92_014015 [Zoarces viviparus]|uniref:Uncharacterized protein n=1 Tax=Zoarces viviparus TaxID=48416 RepID=A0AAW1EZE0_ZOAVI
MRGCPPNPPPSTPAGGLWWESARLGGPPCCGLRGAWFSPLVEKRNGRQVLSSATAARQHHSELRRTAENNQRFH